MAFLGQRRGDITIHGINEGEQFGLRWHRLLFPLEGMPAVHVGPPAAAQLGPATGGNPTTAPDGHSVHTLTMPVDADAPGDQDSGGLGPAADPADGTPGPQSEDAGSLLGDQDSFWHPPYLAPMPLGDAPADPEPVLGESDSSAGHLPKSDAIIWSGPAMAFPADPHETSGDGAASGGGGDTASSDAGAGNLSTAFLPPGSDELADLPHGLDLGFAFTPLPLPPPPDMI
jgi:hypothetical protein